MNEKVFEHFPVIETERLRMQAFTEEDVDAFFELRNHPDVLRSMDRLGDANKEAVLAVITQIIQGFKDMNGLSWVITLKDSRTFIGTFGFWRMWPEHARAEIGYSLMPAHWRKGYMLEAVEPCMQFGFEQLNLHSVMANINPVNRASWKLLEKIGFRQEAHFREDYYANGSFTDSYIYCCLHKDLKPRK